MLGSVVGAIINRPYASVELSEYGNITDNAINEIPVHYEGVAVDNYVIMPNHIHMIITVDNGAVALRMCGSPSFRPEQCGSLPHPAGILLTSDIQRPPQQ